MPGQPTSPQQPLSKFRLAIAIVLFQTVTLFLFAGQSYMQGMLDLERTLNAAVIGPEAEQAYKDRADNAFMSTVVDTGIHGTVKSWAGSMAQGFTMGGEAGDPHVSESAIWEQLQVFWLAIWAMFYRLFSVVDWLLIFIPVGVALVMDALYGRERRKWQYSLTSPLKNETFRHIVGWSTFVLFYAPFSLVPMPMWIVPVIMGVGISAFGGQLRSTQKRV
ncbi:DUF4400 domain-containing protein [Thioalkalivibrio sp. ALE19]|uniref:DUF4400 domain-containing protein n=1 Tax=Thioalkalivibrio sp. ALE19 TaxID=1266909 RepID=UPI00048F860C|nr:DUF4400 domain-containing protein [Thioalkalivibrio sp. ALE19]